MASSDADTKTDYKIPDTYSVPEWFKQHCCKDVPTLVNVDSQLELEDPKAASVEVKESKSEDESVTKAESSSSSGCSSPVVVEAEPQPVSLVEEDQPSTEMQSNSQTTIKAESNSTSEVADSSSASDSKEASTPTPETETSTRQKISRTAYASLKDTFAPALICDHQLLAFEQPSAIALSVNTSKELPLADAVVLQLAKDFGARTILLDAEDVEDLAWEFDKQQKGFDKIKKNKKTAEKEKKKQEKAEKRAAHEKKKLDRAKKKADKEKKAAEEKAKADKTDAEKAGAEKAGAEKAGAEKEDGEKAESSTADKAVVESKPAEQDTATIEKTAKTSVSVEDKTKSGTSTPDKIVDDTKTAEKDTATNAQSTTGETAEDKAKSNNESIANPAEDTSASTGKPATEATDDTAKSTDEKTDASETKADAEKSSDESSTEEKDDKDAKPDENNDDDDDDGPMSETENDESDNDSDSDNGMDYSVDTYEDPCRPATKDTAYTLSRTYFGPRGHTTQSRSIFKRSKAALTSFLLNKKVEVVAETKKEETAAEDASKQGTSKTEGEASTAAKTESADSEQTAESKDDTAKDKSTKDESIKDTTADKDQPAISESSKESNEPSTQDTKTIETPEPVLICIRDANSIMANEGGQDVFGRFCDLITVCREAGQRALLVVTLAQAQKPLIDEDCPCEYPWCGNKPKKLEKLLKRLQIDDSSKIDLVPPKPKKKDGDKGSAKDEPEEENKPKQQYVSIRRLKRYLRHGVNESLAQEWFNASATWEADKPESNISKLEDKKWDDTKVRQAARQIIGRGVAAKSFDFDDVLQVIARLDADGEKKDSDDDNKSEAAKAFDKKLEKIKAECNSHEERILECVVKPADIDSTYDEVIVENDIKDAVRQLITLFKFKATTKSKKLLKLLNISGAMFYGPPGTGKTHLCRAMANDYGACMLALEASTLEDMWVGETEKLIRASFTLATKLHPCILFIDEADSLFRRRTSCDKSWERNALTMYLQQMDGINTNAKRPFVVVATNRPSDLDDAFLRRLPHKVFFNLPTEPQRASILKLFLQSEDIDSSVDINDLAKQTRGLSGSDLKSLCGQAVLAWATEKAIAADSKDDDVTAELKLTAQHFKTAVKRTRPTVSRQAMADVDAFARQYDSSRF